MMRARDVRRRRAPFSCCLVAILVLVGICAGCTSRSGEHDDTPVIGVVASLTGAAAQPGTAWSRGAQLAAEDLEKSGRRVRIVVEDDRSQSAPAASAFQKLVRVDGAKAAIGGTWDYLAEAIYPLARQLSVPFLTPTNPVEILSKEATSNPFVFTNALRLSAVRDAARSVLEREKVRTLALVYSDIPWGNAHAAMLKELASSLGISIAYENRFPLDTYPDVIKLSALKVRDADPDLVFVTFDDAGLDQFASELEKLKASPRVLEPQHLPNALRISHSNEKFRNFITIVPDVQQSDFEKRFQARFGEAPGVFSAVGYDAFMFVASELLEKGKLTRDATFEYRGLTALHRLPTEDGAIAENRAKVMRPEGDALVPY